MFMILTLGMIVLLGGGVTLSLCLTCLSFQAMTNQTALATVKLDHVISNQSFWV